MKKISDELLNQYIDGELEKDSALKLEEELKYSEEARNRLKALRIVHRNLFSIKEDKVSDSFTAELMSKIQHKAGFKKGQNYFIISISSIILIVALVVIGYAASLVFAALPESGNGSLLGNAGNLLTSFIESGKKLFTGKNISIIGSIISLGLIISGYFFFESHRQTREKLSRIH